MMVRPRAVSSSRACPVALSVEVQGRQQAEREEDERSCDERGYEVAHRSSPDSPVQ